MDLKGNSMKDESPGLAASQSTKDGPASGTDAGGIVTADEYRPPEPDVAAAPATPSKLKVEAPAPVAPARGMIPLPSSCCNASLPFSH